MQLQTIARYLNQPCHSHACVTGAAIDSRIVLPGYLFVALVGENSDGHHFALDAEKKGAVAVLCSRFIEGLTIPIFIVPDPVKTLGELAALHRQSFSLPVIALTGSNGKTSVKEMIAHILPKPALATSGNLNNHLGAPLTLFQLNESHRYAVIELGANHLGEVAYTSSLAKPTIALINNIAPAHIGEFGSIENIARAKGEIYDSLATDGMAIVNDDDDYAHYWDNIISSKKRLRFSKEHPADIFAKNIRYDAQNFATFTLCTPDWEGQVTLSVPGSHHVSNALAAASCCFAAGISSEEILKKLATFQGVKGRQTFLKGCNDAMIIDDSYNANLHSVKAAIEVLAAQPGKKLLVLGDMGELGSHSIDHHEAVGLFAKKNHIDYLLSCGQYTKNSVKTFGERAYHYDTQDELIKAIKTYLEPNTTILVKGSRSAAMEQVVAALLPSSQ